VAESKLFGEQIKSWREIFIGAVSATKGIEYFYFYKL
jgi:hypothetical protein